MSLNQSALGESESVGTYYIVGGHMGPPMNILSLKHVITTEAHFHQCNDTNNDPVSHGNENPSKNNDLIWKLINLRMLKNTPKMT